MKTLQSSLKTIEDIDEQILSEFATNNVLNTQSKHILNVNDADVLHVVPIKYQWAFEYWEKGCANNWMPTEVSMLKDLEDWKNLSFNEKRSIFYNLGFFSTAESLIGNNGVLSLYPYITNPEARMYLIRQAYEEALHTYTFLHITESLSIPQHAVFNMYQNQPLVSEKDNLALEFTQNITNNKINTSTTDGIHMLLTNLFIYYVVMEGIWFYGGFPQLLWFVTRNKMPGLTQQIQFILRDESLHVNFGVDLINTIMHEHPETCTESFYNKLLSIVEHAVSLEYKSILFSLPSPLSGGLFANDVFEFVKSMANRRLERINLPAIFECKNNTLPWLTEIMDGISDDNFFERTIRSYRVDGLKFNQ